MKLASDGVIAAIILLAAGPVAAQANFPHKSIRLIVGFPPGSTADAAGRIVGQKLAESLGKPVIVENVVGAAGNIASERLAKALPDGYTLAMSGNGQMVINPSLYKLTYDPVKDLTAVSQVYVSANLLVVHSAVPAITLKQLLALAKARPGELTYASGGIGSAPHIAGELLKSMAGVELRHVPYKGVIAAIPDLLAGRVAVTLGPISQVLSATRDGKLRMLAVSSLRRSAILPDIPTLDESGVPGYEATLWAGLMTPAGTSPAIVRKLQSETVKALALADVRAKFTDLGMEPIGNSADEFAAIIRAELPKWAKLIKDTDMKGD